MFEPTPENRRRTRLATLVVVVALAGPAVALAEPRLADLDWMAGCWEGEAGDTTFRECWMAPAGGLMPGVHRDVGAGGGVFFEFLRILEEDGAITYLAQPSGRAPATPFPLVESGSSHAVFENPDHDFPKRLSYRREGDTLHVSAEGGDAASPTRIEWTWHKSEGF